MEKFIHTQEAVKQRGEVFTPTKLVKEMLDKLPLEVFTDKTKTFLDNSCGNGQFLFAVLERKMENGATHEEALNTIYGVELDFDNAEECRRRLLNGSDDLKLRAIVDHNIICANALDSEHPGWDKVGFYWHCDTEEWREYKKINPYIDCETE
jgi:N-6 DNA Methylase.